MSSGQPSPVPAQEIAGGAKWLAQALDPAAGQVRLVAMDRDSYRAASFLDDRMLQAPVDAQIVPWPAVEEAMASELRSDARWIFHIGHVGSPLVSRLLGELESVLALREPRLLRDLALSAAEIRRRYVAPVPKLMSRTFDEEEVACVKATSFASELAGDLMARVGATPSIAMTVAPEVYIASILGGEASRQELKALAQSRLRRLHARLGSGCWRLYELSEGERAAMSWACEMVALGSASCDALLWIDFERFLQAPEEGLFTALAHVGAEASPADIAAIATGPLMTRYSKGPEHAYSPQLRAQVLDQARQLHGVEIGRGMAWLERAARNHAVIAQALER